MQKEIWKDIEGYKGYYKISNLGRVKSLERKAACQIGYRSVKEKLLSIKLATHGYYVVNLSKNNNQEKYYIHRLIAEYFIPKIENKHQINHINGIKTDNSIGNLEWSTQSENVKHAYDVGLTTKRVGEKSHKAKLTEKDVIDIRKIKGLSNMKISKIYKVSDHQIGMIRSYKSWRHC